MSTNNNFWREGRAEAVSNRGPSAYQPTASPLGQTGSLSRRAVVKLSAFSSCIEASCCEAIHYLVLYGGELLWSYPLSRLVWRRAVVKLSAFSSCIEESCCEAIRFLVLYGGELLWSYPLSRPVWRRAVLEPSTLSGQDGFRRLQCACHSFQSPIQYTIHSV